MRFNRMYKRLSYPWCAAEGLRLKTRKGIRRTTSTEKRRLTDRTSILPPHPAVYPEGADAFSPEISIFSRALSYFSVDVSELAESGYIA